MGLKTEKRRWLIAAGISLALAGLLKRQAAVLFPLFVLLIVFRSRFGRPQTWAPMMPTPRALLALGVGLALGFAPIMAWYASQGALGEFIDGYFLSGSGWKYAQAQLSLNGRVLRLGDGFMGFAEYMATPTLLAVVVILTALRSDRKFTLRGILLAGLLGFGFLGIAIGFRFFKGYYLQLLPAMLWLAAHPDGPVSRWTRPETWRGAPRLRSLMVACVLLLAVASAAFNDFSQLSSIRSQRKTPRDYRIRKIATHIQKNTASTDRIWIWGRWAWPIYFHAERLASTRFYKSLAIFTNNLTNTWRRPTKKTRFEPNSPWPELIKELEASPPVFIVLAHNESYRSFTALTDFIKRRYRVSSGIKARGFSIYRLKSKG
jgi:hypothetical protein